MFSLSIFYLYFHCYNVIQTLIPFPANNLIVLMIIDKPLRVMIEKDFVIQGDYSQKHI